MKFAIKPPSAPAKPAAPAKPPTKPVAAKPAGKRGPPQSDALDAYRKSRKWTIGKLEALLTPEGIKSVRAKLGTKGTGALTIAELFQYLNAVEGEAVHAHKPSGKPRGRPRKDGGKPVKPSANPGATLVKAAAGNALAKPATPNGVKMPTFKFSRPAA